MTRTDAQQILTLSRQMLRQAQQGLWHQVMMLDNQRRALAGMPLLASDEHWAEQLDSSTSIASPVIKAPACAGQVDPDSLDDANLPDGLIARTVRDIDNELAALAQQQRDTLAHLGQKRQKQDKARQGYEATQRLRR